MNNTICAAFWKHTNIRGGNRIFPCCRYKTPIQQFTGNVSEILLTNEYTTLRQDSLAGVNNPNCQKCHNEEQLGKNSLRQKFNEEYDIDSVEIKYLEIGFDNICNLTCDGCWEEWSSSWWIKKNPEGISKEGILNTKEFFNISQTLEKIVFLGGEPLMTNRHRKFLEQLTDLSKVSVTYYTNGMFELSKKDHDVLSKCSSVNFIVSIDAYGELNDLVRQGSNWKIIEKFVKSLPYKKSINSVLHKNSWTGIEELYNWIKCNQLEWTVNILTYPQNMSINSITTNESIILLEKINKISVSNKEYILNYIKDNCGKNKKIIPLNQITN